MELEGQGHGMIMGVTGQLLLGPFYTIQTKTDGCYPIFYQVHTLENQNWHPRNHFLGCRLNIVSSHDSGSRFTKENRG